MPDLRKYTRFLDKHTDALRSRLTVRANGNMWGPSRKALNLFFRAIVYDKILCDHFKVPRNPKVYDALIAPMEIPLDKDAAKGIRGDFQGSLPRWHGIIHLTPEISEEYQQAALEIAMNERTARVHLDMRYWRNTD